MRLFLRYPLMGCCLMSLMGACGSSTGPVATNASSTSPATLLASAGAATLRSTFRVRVDSGPPDRSRIETSYSPPDSTDSVITGPSGISEVITVDAVRYLSVPARPGYYYTHEGVAGLNAAAYLLSQLQSASDVVVSGNMYSFSLGNATGKARLREGGVVWVSIRYPTASQFVATSYSYSAFGQTVSITAPSPDHILPGPTLAPCQENGAPPPGAAVCGTLSSP